MMATVLRSSYDTGSRLLTELSRRNRLLFAVAALNLALAVVFTVLLALDGRTLLGRNVWTKPWKFAVSITAFTATMAWLLPSLSLRARVERRVTAVITVAMVVEITLIGGQAARGVPSHFNTATPLDTAVFAVMGLTITVSTLAVTYVLWRTARDPPTLAPAYRLGIQLGLFVFVVASFEGGLIAARGSHAVGAQAGGPGLPLLNWSVTGGDLRVAHFLGLHALQVLPLAGYLASRRFGSVARSRTLVVLVGVLYGGVTVATFVQALLGLPVVSTLGASASAVLGPWTGTVPLV